MKILMTGFEPFGGADVNPSWEAVKLLPDELDGASIRRVLMPVTYGEAGQRAVQLAREEHADLLICVGMAGSRSDITPELLAVNWRMAPLPDNAGQLYTGEKIDPAKPDAIMTTLPVTDMVEAVKAAGLPCRLSLSAGSYVCNDIYWYALHGQAEGGYKALFIHVPLFEHAAAEQTAEALKICIRIAMKAIAR